MNRSIRFAVCFATAFVLSACQERMPTATETKGPSTPLAASVPVDTGTRAPAFYDSWVGNWTGPEGTMLVLARKGEEVEVTIHSLDGSATYVGRIEGDHIAFDRDGRSETIRATDGEATGMKWLLDKKDCLTIIEGEGFCRD